jgi:hypothetical protein
MASQEIPSLWILSEIWDSPKWIFTFFSFSEHAFLFLCTPFTVRDWPIVASIGGGV